ncbi:oligopeptide/dipeptide ABC transporter ATP-binding protein [Streptosporangium album]|uniref:Oligopeptide/dipeptide ABC transporter ATP-binding protein n=1 Tax=Streptosporangium album TaxID=47479 RepID=A0A7W7RT11_9ACTN|nr:ABC transporter ATP-binding protein [Streptosporangium album]MBB4937668.1 oligopeptide/dipeptide ABC transporter ATP-binding protein [Streptosporangium album]
MTTEHAEGGSTAGHLLEVDDLRVEFGGDDGHTPVLRGVSWHVDRGETLAVLGESGSGKSLTAQVIMGILETPPARIAGGSVRWEGRDLLGLPEPARREIRGQGIGMVFQDALSALNPVLRVGPQIGETLRVRLGLSRREARERAIELMRQVRIPDAEQRYRQYPHHFSGGMRQRAVIAMALALSPDVLIADEPTTALDATVQVQILRLLQTLQSESGMGLVLISHDFGAVASIADRVAVMYAGRVVETGAVRDIFRRPAHPYTRALLDAVPRADRRAGQLAALPGQPPVLRKGATGCPFRSRCPMAEAVCEEREPALAEHAQGRWSACHLGKDVIAGVLPAHSRGH